MWDKHKLLRVLANYLLLSALLILVYSGGIWVTHAALFPVKTIRITGQMKRVTPEELKYVAEHQLSGTFFTLNIDNTRAAFSQLPWVRDVQVRRSWPDALQITIDEYSALARWGDSGLVDQNGQWFSAASDQPLPVLYGPAGAQKEMTQMLIRLRAIFARVGLVPVKLTLSDRRAWGVDLDNEIHVELGKDKVEERALRFANNWPGTLSKLPYRVAYVDMRYPNGFAVRMPGLPATLARKKL